MCKHKNLGGGWHFQISSVSLGGQLQKIVFIRFLLPNIFQIFKSSFFEKKIEKIFNFYFFQNFEIKNCIRLCIGYAMIAQATVL